MSLLISVHPTAKLYRFYTTITDRYLTDWLDRAEALAFIRKAKLEDLEMQMDSEARLFPYGWYDMDKQRFLSKDE